MKSVLVVGSGKRVRETALPALRSAADAFAVQRIFARTPKRIVAGGEEYEVEPLDACTADDVAQADLIYLAVGKDAVPPVLACLSTFDVGGVDLLVDTPVVRFKHFRHADRMRAFRDAWVAEDCVALPWLDTARELLATGALGELRGVVFDRAAYAYHGVATAKAVLGDQRIARARRTPRRGAQAVREMAFASGAFARIVEPRDYSLGAVEIHGTQGRLVERDPVAGDLLLAPVVEGGRCVGFQAGDVRTRLDGTEVELMQGDPPEASVTSRQESMKRVGFLRLLRRIAAGQGAYALDEALDDMVIDYHLEKLGAWVENPFTSSRSAIGRLLLRTLSLAGG